MARQKSLPRNTDQKSLTDTNSALSAELLGRLPPHNLDAEKGILGAMMLDPLVCDDVVAIVRENDFYSPANRCVFAKILEIHNDGGSGDIVLLAERLRLAGELERIGGESYLAEVMNDVQVTAHAKHYAHIVRDKATLRQLIHTSASILNRAFDTDILPQEIINKAAQDIFDVCESRIENKAVRVAEVLQSVFDLLDKRARGETDGIPTGYNDLDSLMGGMHPSELIILAARPSMGKTALAMNIADYVAVEKKLPVLVVSLEMSKTELAQRLICARGRVDSHKLKGGFLDQKDHERINRAADALAESTFLIDDTPGCTLSQIAAVARRLKRQEGLALLVIDYLGLIEPDDPKDPRQEQVAKMARRLKGLARELKIPILCLAQLNRQAEQTRDNRPRLSNLRDSGAIEQDADVVLFVHREERFHSPEVAEEKGLTNKAEIIVAKQRNGPIGDVELLWFGKFTRFDNKSSHISEEWHGGGSDAGAEFYSSEF